MGLSIVLIYRNKAFIPMNFLMPHGVYIADEPILSTELDVNDLATSLERARQFGNPMVPVPDFKTRRDPILISTGARSWKALARVGASYEIDWLENRVELYMSKLDNKGRFDHNPDKTRVFEATVSMHEIARSIIDDWNSRSMD